MVPPIGPECQTNGLVWHDFQKFNLEKYLKDLDARTAEDEYDLGRVEQEFSVIPVWHMQEGDAGEVVFCCGGRQGRCLFPSYLFLN